MLATHQYGANVERLAPPGQASLSPISIGYRCRVFLTIRGRGEGSQDLPTNPSGRVARLGRILTLTGGFGRREDAPETDEALICQSVRVNAGSRALIPKVTGNDEWPVALPVLDKPTLDTDSRVCNTLVSPSPEQRGGRGIGVCIIARG